MYHFFVAVIVGSAIAAAASTQHRHGTAWPVIPTEQSGHSFRRHIGPVNLNTPLHTPRRWGWLHNRMVPAVLERLRA
jgi:hypothetical protein